MQQLINTHLIENALDIRFSEQWYQEDIKQLCQDICQFLPDVKKVESLQGADRETFRLRWQNYYLLLNFDFYSQSCWLEMELIQEQNVLVELQRLMKND